MSGINGEHWLELPARLVSERGTLKLREPPGADVAGLARSLRDGDYRKPFVVEDGGVRRLHFGLDYVQSEMSLDQPDALSFAYTRKMMACLLFVPRPRHIVIVGLGGGSLTKFCYRQLPRARITTVEIDEDVIGFGSLFALPEEDARMRIVHADAADYFARTPESASIVLIDGCDHSGVAPTLCDERFYRNLRARLSRHGMLVMNLVGAASAVRAHLELISSVFTGRILVRSVRPGGNRIVFAFADPAFSPDWRAIRREAPRLEKRHGLDFVRFAERLQRSRAL